jgi:hypothetical protein
VHACGEEELFAPVIELAIEAQLVELHLGVDGDA